MERFSSNIQDYCDLCFGRLKILIKRLQNNKLLFNQYSETIKEELQLNFIEEVNPDMNQVAIIRYLPHHEILTPSKSTTKLWMIYDASTHLKVIKSWI